MAWLVRDKNGLHVIMYSFFEKSMKSPFVMMMNSAVPLQTKRSAPHTGGKEETAQLTQGSPKRRSGGNSE